jgi:hypothetical protein
MKKPADYILVTESSSAAKDYESIGRSVYTDGTTYYIVEEDAPQEAHSLAAAAAQEDPEASDEIMGKYMPEEE